MQLISSIIYIIGIFYIGYAGIKNLGYIAIAVGSLIFLIGYFFVRAHLMTKTFREDGLFKFLYMIFLQVIFLSIPSAIIYFAAGLFS